MTQAALCHAVLGDASLVRRSSAAPLSHRSPHVQPANLNQGHTAAPFSADSGPAGAAKQPHLSQGAAATERGKTGLGRSLAMHVQSEESK